jgi:hypothetical protein
MNPCKIAPRLLTPLLSKEISSRLGKVIQQWSIHPA